MLSTLFIRLVPLLPWSVHKNVSKNPQVFPQKCPINFKMSVKISSNFSNISPRVTMKSNSTFPFMSAARSLGLSILVQTFFYDKGIVPVPDRVLPLPSISLNCSVPITYENRSSTRTCVNNNLCTHGKNFPCISKTIKFTLLHGQADIAK